MQCRRSRSLWLALAAMTACGRLGFDDRAATTDAASDGKATDGPSGSGSQIRLVQATATDVGSNVLSVAFPGAVTAGDMVIVAFDGQDTVTITDSQSNPYAIALPPAHSVFGPFLTIAYAIAGSSGPVTVTATLELPTSGELRIHEFAGLSELDPGSGATGFTNGQAEPPPTVRVFGPPITTTQADELVFEFELSGSAEPGPESTLALSFDSDVTEYQLAPTPGVYVPTVELTKAYDGSDWIIGAAAFR